MINENIKYCRNPMEDEWANTVEIKQEKKKMKCLSQFSRSCKKEFVTTKERRFCEKCTKTLKEGNHL
jgi:hypothetical protein